MYFNHIYIGSISNDISIYFEAVWDDAIVIRINLKTRIFKEIKEFRAYNLQVLVGTAGGYVGLLLGFALKEIPAQIRILYRLLKSKTK